MRGLTYFLALLFNAIFVLSGTVYRVARITTSLNIRSGPGTNNNIVGSLHNNDLIYATSTSNGWAKFYKGYVSMDYLDKATGPVKYVTTGNLNFRVGPATTYDRITIINEGNTINYYGRDPFANGWAVTGNGYASVKYLKEKGTNNNNNNNNNNSNNGKKSDILKKAEAASDYARNHAHSSSTGWCAKYVADALENAGFSFTRQGSACMYHTNGILNGMGFALQSGKPNTLKKGDVAVHGCNSSWPHGHIQIYDGSKWYSDFVQNSEYVYRSNSPPIYYYRISN